MQYGRSYDETRPFFNQFQDLLRTVPRIAVMAKTLSNSDYCNEVDDVKDSYLAICSFYGQKYLYTYWIGWGKDLIDCSYTLKSELGYECQDVHNSYATSFVYEGHNMIESRFCFGCSDCTNCFMSVNLHHKSYYIRNKPYSKEEYQRKIAEYDFGSARVVDELKKELATFSLQFLRRYSHNLKTENCVGDYIQESHNVFHGFDIVGQDNGRYVFDAGGGKEFMDCTQAGFECELMYEAQSGERLYNTKATNWVWGGVECEYMESAADNQSCFGCIGIRKKKYCILNKQYNKEEYEKFRAEIITKMRAAGVYGAFFPVEMSVYPYNASTAQQWYPLTREQVLARGWKWQDHLPGKYDPPTLGWDRVADSIKDVDKSIIKELLACRACGKNYRIVGPEFEFYKKQVIPIPRKCPDCRFYERFAMRNPRRLWHRQCQCGGRKSGVGDQTYVNTGQHVHGDTQCPNEFETPYAPERQEKVYCELCYQKEIL